MNYNRQINKTILKEKMRTYEDKKNGMKKQNKDLQNRIK